MIFLLQSRHNTTDFEIFTLDDVDHAFDKITQLKYSQTVHLKGGYKIKKLFVRLNKIVSKSFYYYGSFKLNSCPL